MISCFGIAAMICVAGYFAISWMNYHDGIAATKKWARINEFPASATNIDVEITGSIFTREFVVTFEASIADIDQWLTQTPGTATVTPAIENGIRKYTIEPGGGAQYAEIQVDETKQRVRIRAFWS